jgi:hypothetical protein
MRQKFIYLHFKIKKMRKILLSIFSMTLLLSLSATAQRICGSADHYQEMLQNNPSFAQQRQLIETQTTNYENNSSNHKRAVVTIPVVFHVVYNTTIQNVSDAQIQSQLTVLNADFRKLNADASLVPSAFAGLAADCEIQFCLAQQDPTGLATTGIIRKSTTSTSFSTNDAVKYAAQGGSTIWDRNKYLNIWVCNLSGGVLGYAQFPGGPAATDGVVITYTALGTMGTAASPYNKGRTATHEVGHWVNLFHIWGDDGTACTGSDLVGDTPNQADENYGCPTFPQVSCSNGTNGDMFMNYMDYTDDACMYMFTTGQKTRVSALFAAGGSRVSLATSTGCNAPSVATCGNASGLSSSSITSTGATISWTAVSGATSYNVQHKLSTATTWTTLTASTTSSILTGLTAGSTYNFQIQAVCASGTGTYVASTFTTTTATSSCGNPTGLTATSISTTGATLGWTAVSGATSYNVQYKLSTATTWTTTTSTTTSKALTGLTAGSTYNFQIQAVCASGTSSYVASTFTTTASTGTCTNNYESNNTRATASTIAINTNITSMLGTSTDKDYFKIVTTTAAPKLKVTLSTLPFDYDLKLYNTSGTLLATAAASGTTTETIKYNTATKAATYYIYVYGYNGAFSATNCYTLNASTSATNFVKTAQFSENKPEINVYPNPVSDKMNVQFFEEGNKQIIANVYNSLGQKVVTQSNTTIDGENNISIDVNNLSNGIYILELIGTEERKVQRFTIQK